VSTSWGIERIAAHEISWSRVLEVIGKFNSYVWEFGLLRAHTFEQDPIIWNKESHFETFEFKALRESKSASGETNERDGERVWELPASVPAGIDGGVDTVQFEKTYFLARSNHIKLRVPFSDYWGKWPSGTSKQKVTARDFQSKGQETNERDGDITARD
jgi:hypothetical protein